MEAFTERFEAYIGERLPEPARGWMLDNDALALHAAWQSAMREGPIAEDLRGWTTPCLIYAGAADELHDAAHRAAGEIPDARFISVPERDHMSADREVEQILPEVLRLLGLPFAPPT
jgi:pimeloyl-ACP methyl ester carboxylesterase